MPLSQELQEKLSKIRPPSFDTTIDTKTRVIANVTFKKGILLAGIISGVVFLLFLLTHNFQWGFLVEFRDVATVFSTCIIVVTAAYAAKSFQVNVEANERKLKFDYQKLEFELEQKEIETRNSKQIRKELYAFELFNKYVSSEMAIHMHSARVFKNDPLYASLQAISPNNHEALKKWAIEFDTHQARKSVMLALNYFEQICLAIKNQLADEDTIKGLIKTVLIRHFMDYKSYIQYRQNVESATFMENLETIAISWSDRKLKK